MQRVPRAALQPQSGGGVEGGEQSGGEDQRADGVGRPGAGEDGFDDVLDGDDFAGGLPFGQSPEQQGQQTEQGGDPGQTVEAGFRGASPDGDGRQQELGDTGGVSGVVGLEEQSGGAYRGEGNPGEAAADRMVERGGRQ